MIQFLRICKPLDDPDLWKRYVPIKREKGKPPAPPDPQTAQLLRVSQENCVTRVVSFSAEP